MEKYYKLLDKIGNHPFFIPFVLFSIALGLFYPFFLLQKIPFPADLLVGSYLPWLDYYKMPVKNPLISDVFSQLYLWKYLAVESIKLGQIPLWNPYSFAGTPLLANFQSAVLNPLNILLFLPKSIGWGIFLFSQTLLSAFSMYLLLKTIIKSPLAQLLGSIIFSIGALMTTWLELGTAGFSMIYLPLATYALISFHKTHQNKFLILLSIIYPLSIFSGNVQISLYTFFSIFLLSVFLSTTNNTFNKRMFLQLLTFQVLGILLSSIQLLPSIDLLQNSIRGADNFIKDDNFGLLPWYEFIKIFNADFFGHPSTRNYYGFLNYFETSLYLGGLSLPFLLYYLKTVIKTKLNLYFCILWLLSIVLTFSNPLSQLLYHFQIPILTQSYASRAIFLFSFTTSIFIAFALETLLTKKDYYSFLKTSIISSAIIIGLLVGIFISTRIFYTEVGNIENQRVVQEYSTWDSQASALVNKVALRNTLIPFVLNLFLTTSIFALIIIKKYFKRVSHVRFLYAVCIVLILFWTADLSRYFLKFNPFTNQELLYPKTPVLSFLTDQQDKELFRIAREHGEVIPPNTWAAYNLSTLDGYDPLHSEQMSNYINFINSGSFENKNATRFAEIGSHYDSDHLDLANVKYIFGMLRTKGGELGGTEVAEQFKKTPVAFQDKSTIIFQNPEYLPRFYFAKKVETKTDDQMKEIFSDPSFSPKSITLVSNTLKKFPQLSGIGEIIVTNYSPNKIILITETKKSELLVLSDQFDKGWKATINNEPTEIFKTNLVYRSILVPAGKNEIVFTYSPQSFILGGGISFFSLIILLLLSVYFIKVKRF